MNDLIAFLAARLDEDEAVARRAAGGSPRETNLGIALFIGRFNPARVLREVEADRRLLAEWQKAETDPAIDDQWNAGLAAGLRMAVQIRAARHSDHPDYRQEWAP